VTNLLVLDRETTNKLFRAKMEHGQLFLFRYGSKKFIFRPLKIAELEAILELCNYIGEVAIEDWIVENTFIGTEEDKFFLLNKTPFLYIKMYSSKIAMLSNIQDEAKYKETVIENRTKINTLQNIVERIIGKAYKSYTHQDIKNMSQARQLEILVKAEAISEEQIDLGIKNKNKKVLRQFTEGATVIGGEDITSPLVADKPEF
jgi:hypothetical protein